MMVQSLLTVIHTHTYLHMFYNIYFFRFFSIINYYKTLNTAPALCTRSQLFSFWYLVVLLFCYSAPRSCLTPCDPMDCSTPGFPIRHYLPGFAEIHVHWTGDAIQISNPLSPPSHVFILFQLQGPFQWVGSLCQVAKVLELHLQHQSF